MAHYSQNHGLSCIDDWGYSESQAGVDRYGGGGASSQVPGPNIPSEAVTGCYQHASPVVGGGWPSPRPIEDSDGTQVPPSAGGLQRPHDSEVFSEEPVFAYVRSPGVHVRQVTSHATGQGHSNVVTGGRGVCSPVTPVRMFRIGVGGEDEHSLRQSLRMRAMAMAEGVSTHTVQGAVGGCDSPGPHVTLSGHGSPSPSSDGSRGSATVQAGEQCAPVAMSPIGQDSRGDSQEATPDGGMTQQGSEEPPWSSQYVLNRIIRQNKRGIPPADDVNYVADGDAAGAPHPAPQRTPPRPTPSAAAATATPSPMSTGSGSRQLPSAVEPGAGTFTGVPPRSVLPPPNNDRWAETETEWLCRFQNEVKDMMGDDTEPYGRARLKVGFWKIVEQRMREKGYNRKDDQCKNKFNLNQILDHYRKLKAHKGWSGLPSYWDMNQTMRRRYNVDFVL
ncbi:hypothetical protein CBR_g30745 [Chara braunii]|uniref:Myb/SANT-like DNA-binding domain-containing protein n=1 Tax=Chara braunii TaxID=69332 RepID=A0A388LDM5_CHABU|nr:hypothetical protein CBR_g30745 [Chara braunii]|eukprot:GBG80377.1 hypothetical protein CBR_g30745 [Chara braunii]